MYGLSSLARLWRYCAERNSAKCLYKAVLAALTGVVSHRRKPLMLLPPEAGHRLLLIYRLIVQNAECFKYYLIYPQGDRPQIPQPVSPARATLVQSAARSLKSSLDSSSTQSRSPVSASPQRSTSRELHASQRGTIYACYGI
ncbi:unnamed protein product [Arctogadus glacialis]